MVVGCPPLSKAVQGGVEVVWIVIRCHCERSILYSLMNSSYEIPNLQIRTHPSRYQHQANKPVSPVGPSTLAIYACRVCFASTVRFPSLHGSRHQPSTSPITMSRHRNIRNLDEDDYYDDYDEDGEYYDEDDYYLEQQREKERKAKEDAEKKAKQNQLKQQQLQAHQKKAAANATSGGVGGGISVSSRGKKSADKKVTISVLGLSVESAKKSSTSSDAQSTTHTTTNDAPAIPQIPANILATLRSINNNDDNQSNTIRSHLSMVILGHVDAGKSTLTGRLLLQLNHVSQRQLQKYQKAANNIGKSSFALAWFTDEDESERERGVTMDVGTKFARTNNFDFTILDAPGHKDFIPNMISGAASADCGLLVIAATRGEFEAGFASGGGGGGSSDDQDGFGTAMPSGKSMGGQTREHIVLSRGLGVSQFVVAVNKLDAAEPPWDEGRFEYIKALVLPFLISSGFKEKRITFVPVSGLTGVNVARDTSAKEDEEGWKALKKWYNGPTLLEALDGLVPAKREFEKPLRLIVTDMSSEGKNVTVCGRVVQGFVRMGDGVLVLPVGDAANVVRLERGKAAKESASPYSFAASASSTNGDRGQSSEKEIEDIPELQNCALAGDTVEVTLVGIDAARLSPGCVICHPHPSLRPQVKRKFEARVMVMEHLAVPVIRGSQVLFHMHSIDVPAVLNKLISSKKRGEANPRPNPRVLTGGVEATVEITLNERLVLEEYSECKSLGRFVLRRGGDTIAVGLIEKVL